MEAAKRRGAFTGAITIASYNWPFYAAAILSSSGHGTCLPAEFAACPAMDGYGGRSALAGWLACTVVLAAHWSSDKALDRRWRWDREFETAPARWIHINAGLEETQALWQEIFPGTDGGPTCTTQKQ